VTALVRSSLTPVDRRRRYATPELNEILYLHHRGISKLEHFEPYSRLRCLHLEHNAVSSLEGLRALVALTQLHVDGNALRDLRGVQYLEKLRHLSANDNMIESLEHVRGHTALETLCVAGNRLRSASSALEPLRSVESLASLDVTRNDITDPTVVDAIASNLSNIELLHVSKGNPVSGTVDAFRHVLVAALRELRWLDDAVVDARARRLAHARLTKGLDGERREHQLIEIERVESHRRAHDAFPSACASVAADDV
jgi:dynein assembly factor 1, axonemal